MPDCMELRVHAGAAVLCVGDPKRWNPGMPIISLYVTNAVDGARMMEMECRRVDYQHRWAVAGM
jgi:hypothetical protein